MNLALLKFILICLIEICKSLTKPENVTPSNRKENSFAEEISVDKDKFLSMENVIKFEKWMVIIVK